MSGKSKVSRRYDDNGRELFDLRLAGKQCPRKLLQRHYFPKGTGYALGEMLEFYCVLVEGHEGEHLTYFGQLWSITESQNSVTG